MPRRIDRFRQIVAPHLDDRASSLPGVIAGLLGYSGTRAMRATPRRWNTGSDHYDHSRLLPPDRRRRAGHAVQDRIDALACRGRDSHRPRSAACSPTATASPSTCGFPREHRTRIRHSDFSKRTFGDTRRRVKVTGQLPGEHPGLSLACAILDRASASTARVHHAPARQGCRG